MYFFYINKIYAQKLYKKPVKEILQVRDKIHANYRSNFEQAQKRVLDAYQTVENFMQDISLIQEKNREIDHHLSQKDAPQLIKVLKSVAIFYKQNGHKLPQNTNLPDMDTDTKQYISLKTAYKNKHAKDVLAIKNIYKDTFHQDILQQNVSEYINNLHNIEVIKMGKYSHEIQKPLLDMFQYSDPKLQCMYIAIQAEQEYRSRKNTNCNDLQELQKIANQLIRDKFENKLLPSYGDEQKEKSNKELLNKYLKEICRVQGKTTINICSIAGAIASQQAIKLMINCFVPVNSGYLFDGAHGIGTQIRLSTQNKY